jgi:PKD repeat protein
MVKNRKEDRMLRELFREKLKNSEVIPSEEGGRVLFRRLTRKEFFHFIPSKFNIWYAGGLAALAATIVLAVMSLSDREVIGEPAAFSPDIEKTETIISNIEAETPVITGGKTEESYKEQSEETYRYIFEKMDDPSEDNKEYHNSYGHVAGGKAVMSSPLPAETIDYEPLLTDGVNERNQLRGMRNINNAIFASVTEGCSPLKVLFEADTSSYEKIIWSFGDGGSSEEANPEWIFDNPGDYEVTLSMYHQGELKAESSCKISVYPRPVTRFEILPDDPVSPDDELVFQNYSTGADKYRWFFGDGEVSDFVEPQHKYSVQGNYSITLVAVSEHGCTDTLTIENAFSLSNYIIEFPNAFIPNPDGPSNGWYSAKSDETASVFHPFAKGVSDYQLRIFSKNGVLLFESNDVNIGWDGYYNGRLCEPGVYIWKVRGNFINREPFIKMGDVTLLNGIL